MGKKRFDYGLILIEHLKQTEEKFVDIRKVAKKYRLPRPYLEKVAQELKRAGWLESRKGADGGYRLAMDFADVSVGDLINFYEPMHLFCPLLRNLGK